MTVEILWKNNWIDTKYIQLFMNNKNLVNICNSLHIIEVNWSHSEGSCGSSRPNAFLTGQLYPKENFNIYVIFIYCCLKDGDRKHHEKNM